MRYLTSRKYLLTGALGAWLAVALLTGGLVGWAIEEGKEGEKESSAKPERIQVAFAEPIKEALAALASAAQAQYGASDVAVEFAGAERLRKAGSLPEAVASYVYLIEDHPDTPHAKAADSRIAYVMVGRTRQELDAMEALLPDPDTLTNVDSLTSVGYFYFMRGLDYQEDAPELAQAYFAKGCDLGWRIFQDDFDDYYKRTVLEAYLSAADAIGQGDAVRAKLSEYADTLQPCFASWVIKTMVDGQDLPYDFVQSQEGRLSVIRFYREMALKVEDKAVVRKYQTNLRDASLQMLLNQPPDLPAFRFCEDYLQASEALGEAERDAAIAYVESLLATLPFSINRWIMRWELAMFLQHISQGEEERKRTTYPQYEKMIEESSWELIGPAVNDERVDVETRGLIMCLLGHARAGHDLPEEAIPYYNWVLEYFPHESHAGETAAYSLADMRDRLNRDDRRVGIELYEQFVRDHPSSYYAPLALMRVGLRYWWMGDVNNARNTYERIVREYPYRSTVREAEEQLAVLEAGKPSQ